MPTVSPPAGSLAATGVAARSIAGKLTNVVTVTGSLYDARTGNKVTSGSIYLTPDDFIRHAGDLIAPITIQYNIPSTGNIAWVLSPSNGVTYTAEYDSDPTDEDTPLEQKPGYFSNTWTLPASGTVDIASL